MMRGCRFGRSSDKDVGARVRGTLCGPLDLFCREDGYTSVAVAVALLVSISLVFCVASVEWTMARSSDIQEVADAAAMAGQNSVAAFYTIAQVLDACVLSLGLTGVTVLGAGLVCAAIPGAQGLSASVIEQAKSILDCRRTFAQTATQGIQRLERALPALCVLNSASCVQANAQGGLSYGGVALPVPLESHSDYSSLASDVDPQDLSDAAKRLADESERSEQAKERADAACERAWRADCVDDPSCLSSRAASLADMLGVENSVAGSPKEWNFGMPIVRSRTYYARRVARDVPEAGDIESLTDSEARKAWYAYALEEVNQAWYRESAQGEVSVSIPHLARNTKEVRQTHLYTDAVWPCTQEEAGRTLHSTTSCPGATGPAAGLASVADIEGGSCTFCETCRMDVSDLGAVASISTVASNGYEHYWEIIVQAAKDYQQARNEQAEAEEHMRELAEEGQSAFERALEQLRVPRPKICPPGAWGCVSVVSRDGSTVVPSELTSAFLKETTLPSGVALSASVLAPDESAQGASVMEHFFDGIQSEADFTATGVMRGVANLWSAVLVSYEAGFEGVSEAGARFLDGVDGVLGGSLGAWIKERLARIIRDVGFEPADTRMRKPVLTSTREVLKQAGMDSAGFVTDALQKLPREGSPWEMARALGVLVWDEIDGGRMVVAELPVPGTELTVPLTVSVPDGEALT